jgi:hypothetical protein
MAFYTFDQNNTHGYFIKDEYLSEYVIIEANSADEANEKAVALGIYFDGIEKGVDCECCGDRWCATYEEAACEAPMIANEPAEECTYVYEDGIYCVIHFMDGTLVRIAQKGT